MTKIIQDLNKNKTKVCELFDSNIVKVRLYTTIFPYACRAIFRGVKTPVSAPKLGAQKIIINDLIQKNNLQAVQSAPRPIITFRVLGNGISKTLNFKIFQGAIPWIPPLEGSHAFGARRLLQIRCAQITSGYGTGLSS